MQQHHQEERLRAGCWGGGGRELESGEDDTASGITDAIIGDDATEVVDGSEAVVVVVVDPSTESPVGEFTEIKVDVPPRVDCQLEYYDTYDTHRKTGL